MTLSPQQKTMLKFGVPIVAVLGLVAFLRSRSSTSSPATGSTAAAPAATTSAIDAGQLASFENNIQSELNGFAAQMASPGGSIPIGVPTGGATNPSGGGATGLSPLSTPAAPSPSPAASSVAAALGFTNPNTPVSLVNGQLIDTGTGRVAYYGPNGQPGTTLGPGGTVPTGLAVWTDPSGKQVAYDPSSYSYAPSSGRSPDVPPSAMATTVAALGPAYAGAVHPIGPVWA